MLAGAHLLISGSPRRHRPLSNAMSLGADRVAEFRSSGRPARDLRVSLLMGAGGHPPAGYFTKRLAEDALRARSCLESAWFGVALQTAEVEQHALLVADDPSVVPRRHVERIARTELALGSIIHPHRHSAFQNVADVLDLA